MKIAKRKVWSCPQPIDAQPVQFLGINPYRLAAFAVRQLACDFQLRPELYVLKDENAVIAAFPGMSVECGAFLDGYGAAMAEISTAFSASLCGIAENNETGELFANSDGGRAFCEKLGLTGADFSVLRSPYMKFCPGAKTGPKLLHALLAAIRMDTSYAALPRKWGGAEGTEGLFEPDELTFFRYVNLGENTDSSIDIERAACLDAAQLEALWMNYLSEGLVAPEFGMLWDNLDALPPRCLLYLELSLRKALDGAGVVVRQEEKNFSVTDSGGKRLMLDYNSRSAAEKLFLKLFFPAPPLKS